MLVGVLMVGWAHRPTLLLVLYGLAGVSDALDGILARRWRVASARGARLDSAADLVFVAAVAIVTARTVRLGWPVVAVVCVVAGVRLVNLIVSRVRFGRCGALHTVGNKIAGVGLFLLWPVCLLLDRVPTWAMIVAVVLAAPPAVEETVILATSDVHDPDAPGWWAGGDGARGRPSEAPRP